VNRIGRRTKNNSPTSGNRRVDRPYRGGRSPDWVKVKNRKHPAMERVKDAFA